MLHQLRHIFTTYAATTVHIHTHTEIHTYYEMCEWLEQIVTRVYNKECTTPEFGSGIYKIYTNIQTYAST